MVQKDEMCAIFKTLKSVDRIEILCGMLQLCVPQELRFIGSCLEDLIQKNYKSLFDVECVANDSRQLKEITKSLNTIDREFCATLNTYLSLLHSDNTSCALSIFSILNNLKAFVETQVEQQDCLLPDRLTKNCNFMDDIILIFTMASYHPAFTITQRLRMYEVCKSLKEIVKQAANQVSRNEYTCKESHMNSCEKPQNIPIEVSIEQLQGSKQKWSDEFKVQVLWLNGSHTESQKNGNQILKFNSQLVHTFPDVSELQRLESCLHSITSNCSASELVQTYEKYFQDLISLPMFVLKCEAMTSFMQDCHRSQKEILCIPKIEQNSGSRSNSSATRFSSSSDGFEFCCNDNISVFSNHVSKIPPPTQPPSSVVSTTSCQVSTNSRCRSSLPHILSQSLYSHPTSNHSRKSNVSTSFSHPNRKVNNSRGHSVSKWKHSPELLKIDSVGSMSIERLLNSQHSIKVSEANETVILTDKTHRKAIEAMKSVEEIDSQIIMTKLLTVTPPEGDNELMNNIPEPPHYDCYPNCGSVSGGGDHIMNSNCTKFTPLDATPFLKDQVTVCDDKFALLSMTSCFENKMSAGPPLYNFYQPVSVETTVITNSTIGSKTLRPILGASANQTNNAIADDSQVPFMTSRLDQKLSNSGVVSSLPRASSCGVIQQHEHDLSNHQASDDNQIHPNFSIHLPSNISFNYDPFYNQNNMDSRLNFVSVSPFFSFNHQSDSHPTPNIALNNLPPHHLNASLLQPFSSSISIAAPCSCCSSIASLPHFSNFPVWPHPIFIRSNGIVGPRYPSSNIRPCASGIYMQTPFNYVPYNCQGLVISSPSSATIPSVPSTANNVAVSPLSQPQQSHSSNPNYCHNCGSYGHLADSCSEPFMLSVGQAAQFKLKTAPKTESAHS